jgi:hypothetical protein
MSTSFFRLRIEWKMPQWGIDEIFLDRQNAGGARWSEEEDQILENLYHKCDMLEILQSLPNRSLGSLYTRASAKKLRKVAYGERPDGDLLKRTYSDIQFLSSQSFEVGKWNIMTTHSQ